VDESSLNIYDLRGVFQFPLGLQLFDVFFNALTGYRAQFRIGMSNGSEKNADLIRELHGELERVGTTPVTIHRLDSRFIYKASHRGTIAEIARTLDPSLSKVWACEKLIGVCGEVDDLFVSRTGPKLLFTDSESWSSLYPESGEGWLDVKGAFLGEGGPYQLKSPEFRAAGLEQRGAA
jgi:hypothetical protein